MSFFKKEKNNKSKAKSDKPPRLSNTVQNAIEFENITTDGILINGNYYSKLFKLIDSNFVTETEDKQESYILAWERLLNKFPDNVTITVVIINERNTEQDMAERYHIKSLGDNLDTYRIEYNKIIDKKIKEGHSDISKEKYILLTIKAKDLNAADVEFSSNEIALQESIKSINKVGVKPLDAVERLYVMHKMFRGTHCVPFYKEYGRYFTETLDGDDRKKISYDNKQLRKAGISPKDLIAPQMIKKTHQCLQLDDKRWCKSFGITNLPSQLSTIFLTHATNLPYEMVTTVQLKTVPRKKAQNLVKTQNVSVKADYIKAEKEALKAGYSADLINEDLVQARENSAALRNDVMNEGKKLFFTTITTTLFAEDEKELENVHSQFVAKCADYGVTPSALMGQQIPALNTSLLCGNSKILIDRLLTSEQACAMFPFNIQELSDKNGHFYGSNAVSKNMIMYDRKHSKLANGLIFGQSGSGKSFITKGEIIPNLLDGKDDMIILDPENEYHVVAEKFGGMTIDLELNADYHINPCDLSMEWDDPRATPLATKCDYMVGLVESILGKGKECTVLEQNAIHRACNRMYEPYIAEMKRRHEQGCEAGQSDELDTEICPTLVDFYEELMSEASMESSKVAMIIEQYAVGNYNLFAHHTNIKTNNRLTVFNLLYLPEKMTEMAMKVCLSTIWTRIVKNREENEKNHTGKSIWVYLDEFHHFFKTESSATTIMAYYKRVRKYGGIMTGITQDVADLLRSAQGTAMFNNTGFFIFLNQSPIGRDQIQNLYNVSDTLIDYIKDKPAGTGLIYNGYVLIPIDYKLPNDNELYKIMSTNPNDKSKKDQIKQEANKKMEDIAKENK